MPSPMAVVGASSRLSIARLTAPRSVVGGTTTSAVAAKVTSATLKRSGSSVVNSLAAAWAAAKRVGSTSVAIIERDTSIAMTMVARSRGTFV